MADDFYNNYSQWKKEKTNAVISKCKEIQNKMYHELQNVTPVRRNVAEVWHITANRYNGHAAVRVKAPEKEQPGRTKAGWIKSTVKLNGTTVYAVRNKNRPSVIHLLNFDHDHFSHGKCTGEVKGTGFVDKVQNEGANELHRAIREIFEGDE